MFDTLLVTGSEHEVEEEGSGSDGGQEEETEDIPQTDTPTVNGKLATTDQDMASLSTTKGVFDGIKTHPVFQALHRHFYYKFIMRENFA